MSKSPAFQLYAADFYMDTVGWTATEVGAYFRLLLQEWVNGPLPEDNASLARIAGVDHKTMGKFWTQSVGKKFVKNGQGQWENSRLELTRSEQEEHRQKLITSGRLGGLKAQEEKRKESSEASSEASSENKALQSSSSSSLKEPLKPSVAKRPKRIAPEIDFDVEIEKAKSIFSNGLLTGVESFLSITASVNKTGKIAQSRELSLLGQLVDVLTVTGPEKFKYGLYAAIDAGVPNINYVKKAANNMKQEDGWKD